MGHFGLGRNERKRERERKKNTRKALNAMNQRRPEGRRACIFGLRALVLGVLWIGELIGKYSSSLRVVVV